MLCGVLIQNVLKIRNESMCNTYRILGFARRTAIHFNSVHVWLLYTCQVTPGFFKQMIRFLFETVKSHPIE